ncbi:hypothetical protein ACFWAY_44955 [Rhodococcus sp. NPDC059968]|uniref:hypothetical protein n=1 Tax=Rhodococcus sp. NPDC059968 TaxID=3347017 RepID=UPI00367297C6
MPTDHALRNVDSVRLDYGSEEIEFRDPATCSSNVERGNRSVSIDRVHHQHLL